MRLKKILIYTLVIFIASSFRAYPYENTDSLNSYGFSAHYILNQHSASFTDFEGIETCCPKFESGSGTGFSLGAYFELPLSYKLKAGLKAAFSKQNGEMISTESVPLIDGEEIITGSFEHILNIDISDFGAYPYISYPAYEGLNLFLGGFAGLIMSKQFDYAETIKDPPDRGVFTDTGTRTRNASSGEIKGMSSVYSGLYFGMNYMLPLADDYSIQMGPDLNYLIGLNNLVKTGDWKISSIRLGFNLKYTPLPAIRPIIEKRTFEGLTDTVQIISEKVSRRTYAQGLAISTLTEKRIFDTIVYHEKIRRTDTVFVPLKLNAKLAVNINEIKIDVQYVTEAFPVLPMVFFEENSDIVPVYYTSGANDDNFSISNLEINPIVFHDRVLDIIGQRLKQSKKGKIELRGYADSTSEKGNCELALSRAENVKKYFVDTWDIDGDRIRISKKKSKCSPPNPTLTPNDSGYSENRRVEIYSEDDKITEPVVKEYFLEITGFKPDTIGFDIKKSVRGNLKTWEIIARQDNRILFRMNGNDSNPAYQKIDYNMVSGLSAAPIRLEFYAEDFEGQTAMGSRDIDINRDTSEYDVERMSLVLFDVGSDRLSNDARSAIKKFIRGLDKDSKVRVYGYTDALGDSGENLKLSANRAKNTADLIRELYPDAVFESIEGFASRRMPQGIDSYSSPAKRFLSRTVQIENLKKMKR
jgi:outer membrane protein OmpA-like peptidoglycan-associated protein